VWRSTRAPALACAATTWVRKAATRRTPSPSVRCPGNKHTLGAATGATTGTIRALQTRLVASFNEIDFAMGETGNDEDFDLIQPYACVNYIIALVGIFPPRT
jgi:microcystin-dependent protein